MQFVVLGLPVRYWLGALTALLLVSTATVGMLVRYRRVRIPLRVHMRLAMATVGAMLSHLAAVVASQF